MGNSTSLELPSTMRRLVLSQPHADITQAEMIIEEVPLPVPKSGQVLVKVFAAAVNPSDYGEWTNVPEDKKFEPRAIGKEGSGVVISSGGGIFADRVLGKNVGFVNLPRGQGAYSEYVTVEAMKGVFPLPETVPVEDAASHFVNPYTAYGFVDTVRTRQASEGFKGTPGFVNTAAASQLGQMLVKLCNEEKVTLINVVRREEQAKLLRALGAEHVVVTAEDDWEAQLSALISEHKIKFAFDAIAGEMTGKLLDCLPKRGTVFVYGRLSNQGCSGIQPLDLIYRRKKLEGWFLTSWIMQDGMLNTAMRLRGCTARVNAGLESKDGWSASQFEDCSLDNMQTKFNDMYTTSGFTAKKLRIRFNDSTAGAGNEQKEDVAAGAKKAQAPEDEDAPSEKVAESENTTEATIDTEDENKLDPAAATE